MSYILVVGLEIHAQLKTRTKLFCACRHEVCSQPNRNVCAICSGHPGTLPSLNAEAVRLGTFAAISVGAEIARVSRFDRKHYFYPDLPKGYQTTQLTEPLASGGGITLANGKRIRFERLHLEEDAGKTVRAPDGRTLVDLNRAGAPLIECVTQPEIAQPEEATEFIETLREHLRFSGASKANFDDGSLRADVNISLHRQGEALGAKVELKNLNSLRSIDAAIRFEQARQAEILRRGKSVPMETRAWDVTREETVLLRTKEDAHDYRTFPDPDLPAIVLDEALLTLWRGEVREPAAVLRARWTGEWKLSSYDADVLSQSPERARYFEACVAQLGVQHAQLAANWIANDVIAACDGNLVRCSVQPKRLAELLDLVQAGEVNRSQGKTVLESLLAAPGKSARETAQQLGLLDRLEPADLDRQCRAAIAANPNAADSVKAGSPKALGALIGPILRATQGKADPQRVRARLTELIQMPEAHQENEAPAQQSPHIVRVEELVDLKALAVDGHPPSARRIRAHLPRGWVLEPDGIHARRDLRLFFREGWILLLGLVLFGSVGGAFLWGAVPSGWAGIGRLVGLVVVLLLIGGLVAPAITRALMSTASSRDRTD